LANDRREEVIQAGPVKLARSGFVIERVGKNDGQARFGVIAGIEEWNEPNRANVDALMQWFGEQQVEAVIVAGGIGPNRESCLKALVRMAASKIPILPLIGATADFEQYRRAVAQAQKQHPNVVDLTTARLIRWDGVDLISLPGYHNPFYLQHRRGGCAYEVRDVEALEDLVNDARQPVLLVAAAPPRGRSPSAIDLARGGVNIGDPALASFIKAHEVPFGVFGHVYEAGGRATADVEGRRPLPAEQWSRSLYLNPGAIEAVPYDLPGGGRSRGMGAVVEIGPEGARYRVRRLESLSPEE
jgi:Icc-related predicted phosphoesterase